MNKDFEGVEDSPVTIPLKDAAMYLSLVLRAAMAACLNQDLDGLKQIRDMARRLVAGMTVQHPKLDELRKHLDELDTLIVDLEEVEEVPEGTTNQ